jgi:hypothetical protein
MTDTGALRILQADYSDAKQMQHLLELLDAYAHDPTGGGEGLSAYAKPTSHRRCASGRHCSVCWPMVRAIR